MQLSALTTDLDGLRRIGGNATITGLASDSRRVQPGFLFAALPGARHDGRAFAADALARGATAVLVSEGTEATWTAPTLISTDPARDYARLAARFFGAAPPVIVAVTGTNGKSSTVNFCRQIWAHMGQAAASIGTLGLIAPGWTRASVLTTPDAADLHADLAELTARGVTHVAMEASSQGLDRRRMDGARLSAGAFTNLTRDHLDYHGTMEAYQAAKIRLFSELLPTGAGAVLNRDMACFAAADGAAQARGLRIIDYGRTAAALRLAHHQPLPAGQAVRLSVFGESVATELPLVGDFQAANVLAALGLVLAERPDDADFRQRALAALPTLHSVRGRLELAGKTRDGAAVYIDYAHTPDGLETMLRALRAHAAGRLHVVFGCGGDRDRGKRPMMASIAARLADVVRVTDDNPRSEDPATIRAEILAGAATAQDAGPRRDAIRAAVKDLKPGDILVIAGKGHEQGQTVGADVLPFDDATEARAALAEAGR